MSSKTILLVEDNDAIRRGMVDALEFAGYRVLESTEAAGAMALVTEDSPDLVLLDVRLPGADGFQILQEIRLAKPRLPVIMVTARGAEEDRVHGLQLGADDYVVKPFSARELIARVEAVLRRCVPDAEQGATLFIGDRVVDVDRSEVSLPDGDTRSLSEREMGILRCLAVRRGRPVPRDELLQFVWGFKPRAILTRTVDMHIARLRGKLEDDPRQPRFILTVRSKGYMLVSQEEAA
jgi:DNA-binding response OmpR family regulator